MTPTEITKLLVVMTKSGNLIVDAYYCYTVQNSSDQKSQGIRCNILQTLGRQQNILIIDQGDLFTQRAPEVTVVKVAGV